ncbi:MAG: YcxB family protein [Clostridia bacterium]|nr:YcxB family protein [Clostridia bacterium]
MPIKNQTTYDKHAMRRFILFNAVKNRRIRLILVSVFGTLGLLVCLVRIGENGLASTDGLLFAALLGLIALLAFRWFISPYFRYGKTVKSWTITLSYEFYTRDFVARSERVNAARNSGVPYSALESVHERKEYIYLYANKASAFIVAKNSFSDKDLKSFRGLLRREVDDKKLHLK